MAIVLVEEVPMGWDETKLLPDPATALREDVNETIDPDRYRKEPLEMPANRHTPPASISSWDTGCAHRRVGWHGLGHVAT